MGKLAILFSAFGALAGCIFAPARIYFLSGGLGFFAGLFLFFAIFYIAYRTAPAALKIPPAEFPGGKWTGWEALKKGFWSYLIAWLISWILVYHVLIV